MESLLAVSLPHYKPADWDDGSLDCFCMATPFCQVPRPKANESRKGRTMSQTSSQQSIGHHCHHHHVIAYNIYTAQKAIKWCVQPAASCSCNRRIARTPSLHVSAGTRAKPLHTTADIESDTTWFLKEKVRTQKTNVQHTGQRADPQNSKKIQFLLGWQQPPPYLKRKKRRGRIISLPTQKERVYW